MKFYIAEIDELKFKIFDIKKNSNFYQEKYTTLEKNFLILFNKLNFKEFGKFLEMNLKDEQNVSV